MIKQAKDKSWHDYEEKLENGGKTNQKLLVWAGQSNTRDDKYMLKKILNKTWKVMRYHRIGEIGVIVPIYKKSNKKITFHRIVFKLIYMKEN